MRREKQLKIQEEELKELQQEVDKPQYLWSQGHGLTIWETWWHSQRYLQKTVSLSHEEEAADDMACIWNYWG